MGKGYLTQAEAERVLAMLKRSLEPVLCFPISGTDTELNVEGDTPRDTFAINIYRGKINKLKYNIGARIIKNGILLLELHINPGNIHTNPGTGEKIIGSHWHIYTEKYDRKMAVPIDIESSNFIENTIMFLKRFNVIQLPKIQLQDEII